MRVLLTGHKGYIGTVLTKLLLNNGHDVVGLDSDLYRLCTYGNGIVEIPEIIKDVRDVEKKDLEGIDAVMHLAGLSNDPLGDLNPELTFEINHLASVRLAEIAKELGIKRFIFSSSCSNYGAAGNDMLTEESEFNPVTPYGISKVRVEQDLSKMADDNFHPTYLRNATAFGMSPRIRFDLVLNNLTAWAFTTQKVHLKSDGTPWRPIVHIEDISRAFVAVMTAPVEAIHNEAFNVGRNEDNFRIREIAKIVADTVPDCDLSYADNAGPDKRNYRVDSSKILRVLPDFKPQWSAAKGAQELYENYKKNGLTLDEFEGIKFQRIAHIRHLISSGKLNNSLRWIG
jgi:nucleoside-diphosphate-sugar epimerase